MSERLSEGQTDAPYFCEERPAACSGAAGETPPVTAILTTETPPLLSPEEFRKLPGYTPAGLVSEGTRQQALMGIPLSYHCEGQPLVDPREI